MSKNNVISPARTYSILANIDAGLRGRQDRQQQAITGLRYALQNTRDDRANKWLPVPRQEVESAVAAVKAAGATVEYRPTQSEHSTGSDLWVITADDGKMYGAYLSKDGKGTFMQYKTGNK